MAASRHNTIDSLVVFAVLAAVITTMHAAETARWRPTLLAGGLLGLAFNVKLLQMILYLPSIYLLYLCSARSISVPRRIWRLTGLTVAMVVVGMSWIVTVDLTPPEQRPYVGGTGNNTALDLVVGERYAAMRILGLSPRSWMRGGAGWSLRGGTQDAWEIGEPGVLRLMTPQLAGQISWFLVLALGGGLLLMALLGRRALLDTAGGRMLLFLTVDAAVQLLFFSTATFHRYYLAMFAPVMAALVGVAVQGLWECYRRGGWERWLLPAALASTAAAQVYILHDYPAWQRSYGPVLLVVCGGAALTLLFAVRPRLAGRRRTAAVATSAAMGALLICPAAWALTPIGAGGPLYSIYPYAGPELWSTDRPDREVEANTARLANYLAAARHSETFFVGSLYASSGAPLMLAANLPAMAIGGYPGSDRILTPETLGKHVAQGRVRFLIIPTDKAIVQGLLEHVRSLITWVDQHCAEVHVDNRTGRPLTVPDGPVGPQGLFDCRPAP